MAGDYHLLDTNVLLFWLRGGNVCAAINQQFQLTTGGFRPLVCEVTLGEMEAFAMSGSWGTKRRQELAGLRKKLVVVDLRGYFPRIGIFSREKT